MEDVLVWAVVIALLAIAAALVIPILLELIMIVIGILAFLVMLIFAPFVWMYRTVRGMRL